jgi:hypothetical protein
MIDDKPGDAALLAALLDDPLDARRSLSPLSHVR